MSNPQLFCFTYAGGTAAFFDEIEKDLKGIECVKLEYSGHGTRHKEEFYSDFDELADDMLNLIKCSYKGGDYGLFGYSMGSISLVEVLRRIKDSGMQLPSNLFFAAHEPNIKAELLEYSIDKVDEWIKDRIVKLGTVPVQLLNNNVFWRTYLPLYRADYMLIGKYKFEKLDINMNVPATIFYSETDTPLNEMREWERYFPCNYFQYQGNHFFIQEHHEEMGKVIRSKMGLFFASPFLHFHSTINKWD